MSTIIALVLPEYYMYKRPRLFTGPFFGLPEHCNKGQSAFKTA